jgi:hypothetical protein
MDLIANATLHRPALATTSAGIGAAVWVAVPWLPAGEPVAVASVGHVFLLMPLVIAPLALTLLARLRDEEGGAPSPLRRARSLQPAAAGLLVVSFALPTGTAAGILAAPWLGVALMLAASGVSHAVRRRSVGTPGASLVAAQIFLFVGAVWLLVWRLGDGPRQLSPLTVSLAALHFHFNGFSSQVLIGATGRRLARMSARRHPLRRFVTVAAIGGLPLLAAGKAFSLPVVRIFGVGAISLALIGLSVMMATVAAAAPSALTRALLIGSAACCAAATGLASAFGGGELLGHEWISVGSMVATHGLLMSVGFTLCGLVGHLRLQRPDPDPDLDRDQEEVRPR